MPLPCFAFSAAAALRISPTNSPHVRVFPIMLMICEREDPAYIVLHQNAVFTAKRRDLPWRQPPSFFLDFGPRNWGT